MKILSTCVLWVCMFLTNISLLAQTPTLVKITKTESNPLRNNTGETFGSGYVEPLGRLFYMIHTSYNNYDMVSRYKDESTNTWSSETLFTGTNQKAAWAYYGSHPNGSYFYDIKYAKEPEIEFNDNGNFNFILTPKLIVNRPHYDIHCFRYDVFDLCIRITSNNKFKLRLLETYVSRRSKFEPTPKSGFEKMFFIRYRDKK